MTIITKKRIMDDFKELSFVDLKRLWRIHRETTPCPICGKPLGSTRRTYCAACSKKRKEISLKNAYNKHYIAKGARTLLKRRYLPLIEGNPLCKLTGFTPDEILDTINTLIKEYHLRGINRKQTLAAALIYLIRKNNLPYTLSNVAEWLSVPNKTANRLWKKIKTEGMCREANHAYHILSVPNKTANRMEVINGSTRNP